MPKARPKDRAFFVLEWLNHLACGKGNDYYLIKSVLTSLAVFPKGGVEREKESQL